MNGIKLIAAERKRQIEQEGWTPEHDRQYLKGELALAAASYAANAATWIEAGTSETRKKYAKLSNPSFHWPFPSKWWKPKSELQDLIRAGALIAAEIDRIQGGGNV
jgi:hypothetical protein